MALRNEEIIRLKYELGYNVTGVGADVYIQYSAVFDRAVQPYLVDVGTTSATPVVASSSVSGTSTTITLAANPVSPFSTQATAIVVGSSVVVDVGPAKETAVVTAMAGLAATMTLFFAHGTTSAYPVVVQGAEQIIRDCFDRLDSIKAEMLNTAPITAGLAALTGELEFFASGRSRRGGRSKFEDLLFQRTTARRDLAGALGIPYMGDMQSRGQGGGFEVY